MVYLTYTTWPMSSASAGRIGPGGGSEIGPVNWLLCRVISCAARTKPVLAGFARPDLVLLALTAAGSACGSSGGAHRFATGVDEAGTSSADAADAVDEV